MPWGTEPPGGGSPRPWRNRGIAILLGIFLGDAGAHNFYLSQYLRGAMHLVVLVGGVMLFMHGLEVSRANEATAGIPAGFHLYVIALFLLGTNFLWRWVEVALTAATPLELFVHK